MAEDKNSIQQIIITEISYFFAPLIRTQGDPIRVFEYLKGQGLKKTIALERENPYPSFDIVNKVNQSRTTFNTREEVKRSVETVYLDTKDKVTSEITKALNLFTERFLDIFFIFVSLICAKFKLSESTKSKY